jgi:flagellar basal-body rod protein FlgB
MRSVEVLRPEQRIMEAALEVRSMRGELLAENVANADTPGYVARDLRFDDALDKVLEGDKADPRELAQSEVVAQNERPDHNDVDANQALSKVYENSAKYVATLKLYGDSIQRLKSATSNS